jgi:hypothetical protein
LAVVNSLSATFDHNSTTEDHSEQIMMPKKKFRKIQTLLGIKKTIPSFVSKTVMQNKYFQRQVSTMTNI